jgi:predicted transcriptional regulator
MDRLESQVDKERRDVEVLREILESGPIGIVRLADETDLPQHKVRYSLRMLEDDGFVEPTPEGAVPADDIDSRLAAVNDGLDELTERLDGLADRF